jgi:alanine dehydrogenase
MNEIMGIRREDKNLWEKRVPLVPQDVKTLIERYNIKVKMQPSDIRIFGDKEYEAVGADIKEDISEAKVVFAIKEIPIDFFLCGKTYMFFSHTIKGQTYNMPMLKKIMDEECQLIDYERVVDENGERLIFFGRYAGIAGMIETLWTAGKRFEWENIPNSFTEIKRAYEYKRVEKAKKHISLIGKKIRQQGLPDSLIPMVFAFMGYGNVSRGAQEIFDCLPVVELQPRDVLSNNYGSGNVIYKVVFKEKDMVETISGQDFALMDYYENPSKYRSCFDKYIPHISVLMNCIYWEKKYPRFITKDFLRQLYSKGKPHLRVIGDISCDIQGAIECTLYSTEPDKPVYTYNPFTQKTEPDYRGNGPVIMAIDNLPCELAWESSKYFSNILMKFIPDILKADFSKPFGKCGLPEEIKKGVILYRGKLTDEYRYLEKYL